MEITSKDGSFAMGTSQTMFKPERVKPCLYVREGNSCYKIASFNDRESMEDFWRVLAKLGVIIPRDFQEE